MSLIGTLAAGDGTTTDFTLENLPEIIFIGDSGAVADIEGLTVVVNGEVAQRNELGNEALLDVIGQLGHQIIDGTNNLNSSFFILGNGELKGQPCKISITNADGAATPNVYGLSFSEVDLEEFNPVSQEVDTCLASKFKQVGGDEFDFLVFDDANFSVADVVFMSGHSESQLTEVELKTLLSISGNVPAGIEANNIIAIDNRSGVIESVKLYATSGGALDFVKLTY